MKKLYISYILVREVAGDAIVEEAVADEGVLGDVIHDDLADVDDHVASDVR
jgi:hypothetical protein